MDFCPRCGQHGTGGMLCANCGKAETSVREGKEIFLRLCPSCKRMRVRNAFVPYQTPIDAAAKAVRQSIPAIKKIEVLDAGFAKVPGPGLKETITITVTLDGETYGLPARFETTLCGQCAKQGGKYFEGILQVRNPTPEITQFIRSDVAKRGKGVFINEESRHAEGIDFKLTSQRYLRVLGKKLVRRFGGRMKVNAQLFSKSRQTSRNIYRINVLYEALPFSAGAVVDFGKGPMLVTDISNKISGIHLPTGKRVATKSKAQEILPIEKSRIVKIRPLTEVLHPQTYQPMPLRNAKLPPLGLGEKVKIVIAKNEAYLVR